MPNRWRRIPLRELRTIGESRAPRLPDCDYAGDADIHLTICAASGTPFTDHVTAKMVGNSVEFCSRKLGYRLYGYCLMPDHLHVLLSPGDSGVPLSNWLRDFKSFTTNQNRRRRGSTLWQRSGYDHVCRSAERAETVVAYIVDNPVRAGLVQRWQDWPWTKVFIDL